MTDFQHRNTKAAKLSVGQVAEIKRLYGAGRTQAALCREFKVSVGQIGRIVRGESWQGVSVEPSQEEIDASWEKLQRMLAESARPKKAAADEMKALEDAFPPINPLDER